MLYLTWLALFHCFKPLPCLTGSLEYWTSARLNVVSSFTPLPWHPQPTKSLSPWLNNSHSKPFKKPNFSSTSLIISWFLVMRSWNRKRKKPYWRGSKCTGSPVSPHLPFLISHAFWCCVVDWTILSFHVFNSMIRLLDTMVSSEVRWYVSSVHQKRLGGTSATD